MPSNGDKVRHRVTGIEGVILGITDWLYGCRRVHVQPLEPREGRPQDLIPFDEPEVEVIQAGFLLPEPVQAKPKKRKTGGPREYEIGGNK